MIDEQPKMVLEEQTLPLSIRNQQTVFYMNYAKKKGGTGK